MHFWTIFSSKTGVRKSREEFLEGIVLEVTFKLSLELGILFINCKWNISALQCRPNVLTRTAEIPHSWRTKEVTDCQFLQYEWVTMPRCRTEGWEIRGENPLKTLKKLGCEKYARKYGNFSTLPSYLFNYKTIFIVYLLSFTVKKT
jgi:hypothetical protein